MVMSLKEGPKITIMVGLFPFHELIKKRGESFRVKRHFPEDKSSSQENPLTANAFHLIFFGT